MSKYITYVDGTNIDIRIPIDELHKMFTMKQLWEAFVKKNDDFHDLQAQCDKLAEALGRCRLFSGNADATHAWHNLKYAEQALKNYKKWKEEND